jgi:hypothetical protein
MSEQIDNGGPAFPIQYGGKGMTLRDYFAAAALQGAMVTAKGLGEIEADTRRELLKQFGSLLYEIADAMLAARKEKP